MAKDRFYIGPFDKNSGQQTDYKPYLIPDEAFEELTNAYVYEGRVRKRFGSRWLGDDKLGTRLRVQIGTTMGNAFNGFVPRNAAATATIAPPAIGQMFSVGSEVFTVNALGNPANMLISGAATTATFDTTSGQVILAGVADMTAVYYYPALPVMGLLEYDTADINDESILAFDTRFAYSYGNGWNREGGETTPDAAFWTGTDSEFFWSTTWLGSTGADKIFFVTNFNESEANFMRTFDGTNWDNFRPQINSTPDYMFSARIIVVFKNRLIFFNTWEGANLGAALNYQNRCRYSAIGSPLAANAFRQDLAGEGNAIDCPSTESIVTVEFIRDRLIVFLENSTWELVYTGNQAYPFSWQQINTELGAESTFSVVPFDKVALGVGNVGIHSCNGTNVDRIDDKIPQSVFNIHNTDGGIFRVYGVRDYFIEAVYWTFPNTDTSSDFPYPNKILVYNYKTATWSFNDDSITVFGQFYQPSDTSITWNSTSVTWDDEVKWNSGSLSVNFRQVIAGNQEGYTFICDTNVTTNAAALQITDLAVGAGNVVTVTCVNHNLRDGDFILIQDVVDNTGNLTLLNDKIFKVDVDLALPNEFYLTYTDGTTLAGVYQGAGIISRVSKINILTKQYNFYATQARDAYISKVDFMVDKTALGELQVNYFVSTSDTPLVADSLATGAIIGTSILDTYPYTAFYPYEANATRLWHPVYFQAEGEVVQLQLTMNDEQMTSVTVNLDGSLTGPSFMPLELHAMMFYATPTSRLQ